MYIRTNLIKIIKQEIYKLNIQKELSFFLEFCNDKMHSKISSNVISKAISQIHNNELKDLLKDLQRSINDNSTNECDYRSELGISLKYNQILINKKLKKSLKDASSVTQEVAKILSELSKNSALVGGCVRDSILGITPKDWDFVTDVHYNEVKKVMIENNFKVKEAGKQFLVMIVSKKNLMGIYEDSEIAMFRKDGIYNNGRQPLSVEIGTIFEDSLRRDLTLNALYYNIHYEKVQDPNGIGIIDINNKILRFIGKADDRIKEDYLRIARFYRFLGRFKDLGFKPDNKSLKACRMNFPEMQKIISSERLRNEIEKMVGL